MRFESSRGNQLNTTGAADWASYRALFPALREWAYFGWASVAPLSSPVSDAMHAQIESVRDQGVSSYRDWYAAYDQTRAQAAQLIGADPQEIALLKNTSEGISTVACGLELQSGDNVVLPLGEFPANAYPWLALRERGIEVRRVATRAQGAYAAQDVQELLNARTRVLAVSFVNFTSGFRTDLAALGKLCRERGIFFFVDAIQGLGALPLEVQRMAIDGLAADGHKWLCGPEGQALLFIRSPWRERIRPLSRGWWSVQDPGRYELDDQALSPTGRRYECGTLCTAAVYGFRAALELANRAGVAAIAERIARLAGLLAAQLRARGLPVFRAEGPAEWSGIVSFEVPGRDAKELAAALERSKVLLNPRLGRLRAAVHAWNNEADIARLLEALPKP